MQFYRHEPEKVLFILLTLTLDWNFKRLGRRIFARVSPSDKNSRKHRNLPIGVPGGSLAENGFGALWPRNVMLSFN